VGVSGRKLSTGFSDLLIAVLPAVTGRRHLYRDLM